MADSWIGWSTSRTSNIAGNFERNADWISSRYKPNCRPCAEVPPWGAVLRFERMRNAITVRVPTEVAEWLDSVSREAGVPRGRIIRDQLQPARKREKPPFMRVAGSVEGPPDLSTRKGFGKTGIANTRFW